MQWIIGAAVFLVAAAVLGATVAGPGLSWDEPAYRHSQVTLQSWLNELVKVRSLAELSTLLSADAIDVYFEYNRMGHNFHPPMAGYLNLLTYGIFGGVIEDICARRLASAFEMAGCVALIYFALASRMGTTTGLFAAATFLFMPRVVGNAHLIDTDMPLLFFWSATALAFEAGMTSRRWQWVAAIGFGCLFLVKFSGVVIAAPCGLWFAIRVLLGLPARAVVAWSLRLLACLTPTLPFAFLMLFRPGKVVREFRVVEMSTFGLGHPAVFWLCLLGAAGLTLRSRTRRLRSNEQAAVALEMPALILAIAPLVAIALNPTWWHDPAMSLASYFNLNLDRQAALPTIGIFYLGKRYFYSLPWHNAPVLMAVTIPFGTLALGAAGCGLGLTSLLRTIGNSLRRGQANETALFGGYCLLQCWTLPIFRMAKTPAHDGVRLFLPSFFFWSVLAAIAANCMANRLRRPWVWLALFFLGPAPAAWDWLRIHPFELSYYNIGLRRAFDCGFEATYWYDAVTPKVLADLNQRLPKDLAISHYVDPLINAEVFPALQSLGKLRSDIQVDPPSSVRRPWLWLLTHSSKATAFTRLLYSCRAWAEYGKDGVKLFSVVDADNADLTWALWALAVDADFSERLGSLRINGLAFTSTAEDLVRAAQVLAVGSPSAEQLQSESLGVRELVAHWLRSGRLHASRATTFRERQPAIARAARLLATRGKDIRAILESEGYLSPDRFGGWLE